ncbi:hypothetical protein NECAME_03324 [Necator americanus]|uniref:Uncharacterized protein n=1 Tax=Necator americanus TaxID=51031 RepID=W2T4E5_NECAM|nr:hypothetical protein NECAME_03324 [Necator americanus]ETN76895.1 hypothetical protein NECAME_03324 [Necator americanus]
MDFSTFDIPISVGGSFFPSMEQNLICIPSSVEKKPRDCKKTFTSIFCHDIIQLSETGTELPNRIKNFENVIL